MRRVIAISLAILVVTIAARGVVAQETQQDGNNLLLKILKERNVLTDSEFQEIKGQLAQEQSAVDQKLTALDRSLADYLAKAGDVSPGNTTYVQNQGVTFGSGDGTWNVFFGGLFQFSYMYASGDSLETHGGFGVDENRLDFGGTIFDPNLTFYVQAGFMSDRASSDYMYPTAMTSSSYGGFELLDAYVNWKFCDVAQLRAGQFKVPYGRQFMTDQSDRAFGRLGTAYGTFVGQSFSGDSGTSLSAGRDVGIMFHNVADLDDNANGMKLEWALGLWNGSGGNTDFTSTAETWLMYGFRLGFYPMGYIPYVEGDWAVSQDPKFGIAGSYFNDTTQAVAGHNPARSRWEIDAVLTWMGLYLTGEYHTVSSNKYITSTDMDDTAWFVQAGYFVMPQQLEILLKYTALESDSGDDKLTEWAIGLAYYFNGHEWKVVGEFGMMAYEAKGMADEDNSFFRIVFQADW
jgi:hypothetical protein